MSALRSFCLWMFMLALPLQGFAAASMRLCGTPAAPAASAGMKHHGQHGEQSHEQRQEQHHGQYHGLEAHPADAADPVALLDGPAHDPLAPKCAVCASCCTAMAPPEFPAPLQLGPVPHAGPAEPLVLIQAVPARVPDKPPRT